MSMKEDWDAEMTTNALEEKHCAIWHAIHDAIKGGVVSKFKDLAREMKNKTTGKIMIFEQTTPEGHHLRVTFSPEENHLLVFVNETTVLEYYPKHTLNGVGFIRPGNWQKVFEPAFVELEKFIEETDRVSNMVKEKFADSVLEPFNI